MYNLTLIRNGRQPRQFDDLETVNNVALTLQGMDLIDPVDDWQVTATLEGASRPVPYHVEREIGRASGYWRRYDR